MYLIPRLNGELIQNNPISANDWYQKQMKLFAFTLDLESDHSGLINSFNLFKETSKIEELLLFLKSFGVKLTVFSVGKIIEEYPNIIKLFEKYDCQFELHSYSHNLNHPDSEYEIKKSKEVYIKYFNKLPKGYRAPAGKISKEGIKILSKEGFLYDSSIFPSYYPNPFKYFLSNRDVHFCEDSNIMEIPFSSITPFRIILSMSYVKLLGINFFMRLFKMFNLPKIICFDSHLHDFIFNQNSYNKLPFFWKVIYNRNKYNGLKFCIKLLKYMKKNNYKFCYMSELYELKKGRKL